MRPRSFAALVVFATVSCRGTFHGPDRLLRRPSVSGVLARSGTLSMAGEPRPALLESARYEVTLPHRPLLTFGIGLAYAGPGEAPGWYRVAVRSGKDVLFERTLNPRAAAGWKDVSLPLERQGGHATLEFDLRLTDREGRDIPRPAGLMLGVADPVVHDLADYGRHKGVVLVSIDTLRRDHVGAYGYGRPTTPRLDALAGKGILCEDAVSTSSWTLPSHLSMLTSADPARHGGTDMKHGFNHRVPSLPATLRHAGFATQAVTSHLYVSSVYGLQDGFDHLDFRQDRRAAEVADRATSILDRVGDRPFFLFLHFYDPHWHYDPPDEVRRLFDTGYGGNLTGNWQDFSKRDRATVSERDLAHLLALYDAEIRYTDTELGRVFDHLTARGLDKGTLVFVTSDHGEEFLEHGSWEHQKTLYEEVVRIPMMFAGPGIVGRRETRQTTLLDVAPTILAWTGVAPRGPLQGESLVAPVGEREAYGETDHTADGTRKLFLRGGQGRWKAILSLSETGGELRRGEWFNLSTDPGEGHSTRPNEAAAQAIERRALDRWREGRKDGPAAPAVQLTPEQVERLKALGYVAQ